MADPVYLSSQGTCCGTKEVYSNWIVLLRHLVPGDTPIRDWTLSWEFAADGSFAGLAGPETIILLKSYFVIQKNSVA